MKHRELLNVAYKAGWTKKKFYSDLYLHEAYKLQVDMQIQCLCVFSFWWIAIYCMIHNLCRVTYWLSVSQNAFVANFHFLILSVIVPFFWNVNT